MAAASTPIRCDGGFQRKKLAPAQQRTLGPPRYATRGILPVARRNGERGKPRQLRRLCLSRGVWRLNGPCSLCSGKSLEFQSVSRLKQQLARKPSTWYLS